MVDAGESHPGLQARIADLEAQLELARAQVLQTEQRLTRTEQELWQTLLLIGSAPIPVVLFDASGRVTDVNHEAERFGGKRREELIGRRFDEFLGEDERREWNEAFAHCVAGNVVRGVERPLFPRRQDAKAVLLPLRSEQGELLGVALSEDIQEIKDSHTTLAEINRELRQLASQDPLTGLSNRRSYESVARREFGRAARGRNWVSVLMIDIDLFKSFNDELGHAAGDECLRRTGEALRGCLRRPGDLLARFGGEEFVVLLPETDLAGARSVAARMRAAVEELEIARGDGSAVTCSIGVASSRIGADISPAMLEVAADEALYRAKELGRNRVQTALPPQASRPDVAGVVEGADSQ